MHRHDMPAAARCSLVPRSLIPRARPLAGHDAKIALVER
jgi:hypothetical protein